MSPLADFGWESWRCPVVLTLGLACAAAAYLRGWLRLRSTSSDIPTWRAGGCLVGLSLIWVAWASPMASCDEHLLTFHMVNHLLLMSVAPPLILLGEAPKAWWHARPFVGSNAGAGVGRPFLQRLGRALGHPTLCWLAATATLVAWHVPSLFALALRSPTWHTFEQATFLATGVLFWWPVVRPWPSVAREPQWSTVLYLFLATLPCDILSGFLVFSERVAYPVYLARHSASAVLGDQERAGALMWTVVTIVYLVAGTVVTAHLLASGRATEGQPALAGPTPSAALHAEPPIRGIA
jgi:cytochrome c oxidase assembly factor CtaG